MNAYLLAAAAAFPLAGRLADVIGYRRMMIAGIIVFALASAACGATPTGSHADAWLVTARIVQGAGSALMFPSAIGLLVGTTSPARRARSMAAFFAISGAMTAIGPLAGANGYLLKDVEPARLAEAIRQTVQGGTVLDPRAAQAVAASLREAPAPVLSSQEQRVVQLVAVGHNTRIANDLCVSESTVKTYLARAFQKLGVNDRAAAVAEAIRRGIIQP